MPYPQNPQGVRRRLSHMSYKPIGDYGLIGNMRSAALVSTDGSIDWCCLPRFDSPSVFAAILDDEKGGRFSVQPLGDYESRQSYIHNTNVLATTFETPEGSATVTDFMPCYHTPSGRFVQKDEIHRLVECTKGSAQLAVDFKPRLDYARDKVSLETTRHGVAVRGTTGRLALSSSHPLEVKKADAGATVALSEGQSMLLDLRWDTDTPKSPRTYRSRSKLRQTEDFWRKKAEDCKFTGEGPEEVVRSYLALHLMAYMPKGALIAAPTTSLPEDIGGQRNWDYRFAWLRDASLTLDAFLRLGHKDEALAFFNWLLELCGTCGPRAQILYNIDLGNPPDEKHLDLRGYRDSRPVRIGNDAYKQLQLDVFGEVLDAAGVFADVGGYISQETWRLLEGFVDAAADLWQRPDSGIWEVRGGPFHFVHSKLMCWVALDRGANLAERFMYGTPDRIKGWREAANDIREDILQKGWNPDKQAFTQHYDTSALDASTLLMPLYGFLPVSDEKMRSSIERTVEELAVGGVLRRYLTEDTDDGLPGSEGAFLWCSFWLVRALIQLGRVDEATSLYKKLLGYSNHLGLLSEMVDPKSGELLGNFPQALTHLAVITVGLDLAADRGKPG